MKHDWTVVGNNKVYLTNYSVGFIRQNYMNIILELSSLRIHLWISLLVIYSSTQLLVHFRVCLSRSVISTKYLLKISVTVCAGEDKFLPLYFHAHFSPCLTKWIILTVGRKYCSIRSFAIFLSISKFAWSCSRVISVFCCCCVDKPAHRNAWSK